MNRRTFLASVASAAASVTVLGGCAATGLVAYRQPLTRGRMHLKVSEYPELASEGGAIEVTSDDLPEPVVVVHEATGGYVALSPVCTHLGCTVRKEPSVFRCPCHGSTYALDGTVVRGPAERSLLRYHAEYNDGIVAIQVR